MSYNTRRQSGQGVGRGSAQVLYHQPQRTPARMQQSGPGYNTQQQIQTVSSGYNTQPNAPAYTTQSQPPPTQSASQGYTSQQVRGQTYQTQPQPPQQPPPQPPVPQPPVPQSVKPEPLTPKGVKVEPPVPKTTPVAMGGVTEMETESALEGAGDTTKLKSWQLKKKMPGFKINKKVKKRRQNARLRKILQPKNAIMVLNELKTGIKFTFQEHTNALTQTMFVVNAEVDGKVHTGQGLSKPLAKQNAAENALKALLLEKMAQAAVRAENSSNDTSEPMQEDTNNGTVPPPSAKPPAEASSEDGSDAPNKPEAPEDDVPWGSLASFALYKLFTDWQSQGTHVPIPKQAAPPVGKQMWKRTSDSKPTTVQASQIDGIQCAPAPMKKIPDNPTDRHPVMLLNQMRPGIQFTEISREGTPPNLTFTLGVTVDGKSFTGVAKNKKDAKKEAAKAALAGTLNIFYD